jgi:hypothetical protein
MAASASLVAVFLATPDLAAALASGFVADFVAELAAGFVIDSFFLPASYLLFSYLPG